MALWQSLKQTMPVLTAQALGEMDPATPGVHGTWEAEAAAFLTQGYAGQVTHFTGRLSKPRSGHTSALAPDGLRLAAGVSITKCKHTSQHKFNCSFEDWLQNMLIQKVFTRHK